MADSTPPASEGPDAALPAVTLVDAHAHLPPGANLFRLLETAAANFARARAALGFPSSTPGALLLAETSGVDRFRDLADGRCPAPSGWTVEPTSEQGSLRLRRAADGTTTFLLAGRQVACEEGIEVLTLASPTAFVDGRPARSVIVEALAAGALPVLPWGFGKWLGRRGRVVRELIASPLGPHLFLGDTGVRWKHGREPAILREARDLGLPVLPGSDPFPLRGVGPSLACRGFVLPRPLDPERPAASLKAALATRDRHHAFGAGSSWLSAVRAQVAMQARKLRRDAPTSRALVVAPQPFFTPRGTPLSVYYRTQVMAGLGVQVDLLTYGEGEDVDLPGVRVVRIPRLSFLGRVPIGPSKVKALLDVLMVVWTLALLLRRRYDFVHAHEEAAFWCLVLRPLLGFRFVYDMHSVLSEQLSNFAFTRSHLLIGAFERLERAVLRHADAVITICPEVGRYALEHGLAPERHLLIENSIVDEVRLRLAPGSSPEPPTPTPEKTGPRVVYAGTLEPYQGVDLLIEAVAEVRRLHPGLQLLVVGGTVEQVRRLSVLAGEHLVSGSCFFTGGVDQAAARALLRSADVLVSPRLECRNTPLKLYEQLASGKPLVATDTTGHRQAVRDGTCFLVEPTPRSLAQGLLEALGDPAKAARTAAAARQLYEAEYSRAAYESKVRRLLEVLG